MAIPTIDEQNIIDAIKFGEKIFNRGVKNISPEIRDLYNIMLVISKSISINLLDLESFENAVARPTDTVDLPVPPLPEVTTVNIPMDFATFQYQYLG